MTPGQEEQERRSSARAGASSRSAWALLAVVALLALTLRCLGFSTVFVDDDTVVFQIGDPYFHVYRALASLDRFPWFLSFDRYTNFPHGAVIPAPPLYDLLVAGLTRLLFGDQSVLERVAAWLPPVLAAATVVPVARIGRLVGGPGVGLGAAVLFALLPASASYSQVGYADHHAALCLLTTSLLALQLTALDPDRERAGLGLFVGLSVTRSAMILTWSGSLLYVGLGDGVFVVVAAACGRRDLLRGLAFGAAASALLVLPFVVTAPPPAGGAFSAVQLSYLHLVACLGIALWSGLLAFAVAPGADERRSRPGSRVAAALVLALVLALVAVAASGAWSELLAALRFLGKRDAWGGSVLEQTPLFVARPGAPDGLALLGGFAWLVPAAPLIALLPLRDPRRRASASVLIAWSAVLALLALSQVRFANEFAPVGAVLFALLLGSGFGRLARRLGLSARLGAAAAVAAAGALLVPAVTRFYWPFLTLLPGLLLNGSPRLDPALRTVHGSALRFAQELRRVTPETSGFLHPDASPEYCLLASPNLGHLLQYAARRPTATNNFGPYAGLANAAAVSRFFGDVDEATAFRLARRLGCRYVVTNLGPGDDPDSLRSRLHVADGRGYERHLPLARFRLVTEGPASGAALATLYRPLPDRGRIPYKLFEVVEGAILEIAAPAGERVAVEVTVRTPLQRIFHWRVAAQTPASGVARIRVPYATRTQLPARPEGPYSIRVGDALYRADVTNRDVRTGAVVRVGGG